MHSFQTGQVAQAEQEAAAGYKRFHSLGSEWAWKFLLLQAEALSWRGMNDRTLPLITAEKTEPSGDLAIRKARIEGSAYTALHRFQEAEQKLHEAEQLCGGSKSSDCTGVTLELGFMEMSRGKFEVARGLFGGALAAARERRDAFKEASALLDLGWSALQQEHYDEMMDWSNAAYKLAAAIGAERIAETALGNEGWAYYKLGEHEKALNLLLDARHRAHKIGATTDEATWLTTSGYIYLDAEEFEKAEQNYKEALDLAQQTTKQDVIDALVSLALVSERSGRLDQARDYADQTIALVPKDGNRLDVLYPMLVKGHVAARIHDPQQAEKNYREIEQDPKSHVFLKWEAEHSLAQLYEDENQSQSADREYRAALSTFETARSSLKHEESELPFPSNALGIYDDYIHFLARQGKTTEALQVAEYSRGRNLAEGLGLLQKGTTFKPVALNPQEIAQRAGGTILFYWLGEKQSYLWTITAQKISLFTLPPKSEIDTVVRRYRKALSEQQEFLQTADDDARTLYRTLVLPAKSVLPENAKVIIIPDGSLNVLNFETLLVPDPTPHYWIEDVTITDANSLRLLTIPRSANRRNPNLLLLGNAVAPNTDYPELRKAAAEMESIAKNFSQPQQKIFARETATPTAYLSGKPELFSYIHFVAHGTASRTSPLDSAIVLSKAGPEDDSFKLYARDIIHHPLHAELVTISTCYGAGARAYTGEGLVGLSWAFLRAGAHNVIGALWEVSDVSTPQLMDELYGELAKGKTPDTALRNAKLKLLRSSTAFRKPFYWAPFQLYTGS
jgi:CHAT domain-containing protein/Tfp pilus assembly protein PilF